MPCDIFQSKSCFFLFWINSYAHFTSKSTWHVERNLIFSLEILYDFGFWERYQRENVDKKLEYSSKTFSSHPTRVQESSWKLNKIRLCDNKRKRRKNEQENCLMEFLSLEKRFSLNLFYFSSKSKTKSSHRRNLIKWIKYSSEIMW